MYVFNWQEHKDQTFAYGYWVVECVYLRAGERITSGQNRSNSKKTQNNRMIKG